MLLVRPAPVPPAALRGAWVTADRHLTAYGHDMTWVPGDGQYHGTCERCAGRVAVITTRTGPQPVAGAGMTAAGCADYAECAGRGVTRRR
jgi:hypothetical protein